MTTIIEEAAETHTMSFSDANVTVAIHHDGDVSVVFTSPGLHEMSFDWTNWLRIVRFAEKAARMTADDA